MGRRLVDLSITIEDGLPSDPPAMIPRIMYMDHQAGAASMAEFFPGIDPEKDLPGGLGWAVEMVTLSTHSGTHLDAPWHYHPTMDRGKPALTIDEVPLEWCMGPGVVLDFRHLPDGYRVTASDVEEALARMDYRLKEGDIVLVMTGADKYWGKPEYLVKGCGMSREATLWILEHGVRVTGTDAWSWDRPLPLIARDFQETGDSSLIWEGHFASIEKGYCHIEKLANLDQLPPYGFTFFCFPVKVKKASAGWIRAVALIED
ncbi:cyclase family protein [Candidatus Solincola sp.]|nr:cyclase family protein [Actinomycetota bacterium]